MGRRVLIVAILVFLLAMVQSANVQASQLSCTWAVIVSSSRYWFNYRHTSNALSIYGAARRLGIPDERIILMLADNHALSAKNSLPGSVFNDNDRSEGANLHPSDVEVDYTGPDVTPESLMRLLSGRHPPGTPLHRMLRSGPSDRVILYLTGHGGDGFLKFHDKEELAAQDLAGAVQQAKLGGRFREMLVLLDTCQAATLTEPLHSGGIIALASSVRGENSYAHGHDSELGQALSDGFTRTLTSWLHERIDVTGMRLYRELEAIRNNVAASVPKPTTGDPASSNAQSTTRKLRDVCESLAAESSPSRLNSDNNISGDTYAKDGEANLSAAQGNSKLQKACRLLRNAERSSKDRKRSASQPEARGFSCADLSAVFPAFARLARRYERTRSLSLGRLNDNGNDIDNTVSPDGAAGCVLAGWATLHQAQNERARAGIVATIDPRLLSVLERILAPPPQGYRNVSSSIIAHNSNGAFDRLHQQQQLSIGAFFRFAPKWRTASTTYVRADLLEHPTRQHRLMRQDSVATTNQSGKIEDASVAFTPTLQGLQDPFDHSGRLRQQGGGESSPAGAGDAATMALLDSMSLLEFFSAAVAAPR